MSDPANLCTCEGKGKCLWCAIERALPDAPSLMDPRPWPPLDMRKAIADGHLHPGPLGKPGQLSNVAFDEMVGPDGTTRDVDAAIAAAGPREKVTWTFKNGNKLVFAPPLPGDANYRSSYNTRSWDLPSNIPEEPYYYAMVTGAGGIGGSVHDHASQRVEITKEQYEQIQRSMTRAREINQLATDYESLGYPETVVHEATGLLPMADVVNIWAGGPVWSLLEDLMVTYELPNKKNDSGT